jgi:hypothetical protein
VARCGAVIDQASAVVEDIMFRAVWNGAVLAESDHTVKLEGNHYFPAGSLRRPADGVAGLRDSRLRGAGRRLAGRVGPAKLPWPGPDHRRCASGHAREGMPGAFIVKAATGVREPDSNLGRFPRLLLALDRLS